MRPKAGDDLVEDQQDVVLGADLAQALQIAHRRHDHPGRTGHGLDDDRGDVGGVVQLDQLEQLVGQLDAAGLGHAFGKGQARLQGVRQVIDVHEGAVQLPVAADAAQAGAGDVDAVVATGAADQLGLGRLALDAPVGAGQLDRGISALGARTGEEDMIETGWSQLGHLLRQLEGQRMAVLEARRIVEGAQLPSHGLLDLLARVTGAAGPEAGEAVIDAPALVVRQPTALGGHHDTRVLLEGAIGGEGHPVGAQVELGSNGRSDGQRLVHDGGSGVDSESAECARSCVS
ncbi:hypothetical protein Q3H58_001261 [Pseudomonas psychrotolerans]|nr:hypothetical protein [Pseudomonas psychrotolerans]